MFKKSTSLENNDSTGFLTPSEIHTHHTFLVSNNFFFQKNEIPLYSNVAYCCMSSSSSSSSSSIHNTTKNVKCDRIEMESNVESKSEKKDVDHEAMDEKKYEKIQCVAKKYI